MKEGTKKLSDCVLDGYAVSLKPHHGMIIKGTFSVAVKAAPSRDDFIKKLGSSEEEVFGTLKGAPGDEVWDKLSALVDGMQDFLKKTNETHLKP